MDKPLHLTHQAREVWWSKLSSCCLHHKTEGFHDGPGGHMELLVYNTCIKLKMYTNLRMGHWLPHPSGFLFCHTFSCGG